MSRGSAVAPGTVRSCSAGTALRPILTRALRAYRPRDNDVVSHQRAVTRLTESPATSGSRRGHRDGERSDRGRVEPSRRRRTSESIRRPTVQANVVTVPTPRGLHRATARRGRRVWSDRGRSRGARQPTSARPAIRGHFPADQRPRLSFLPFGHQRSRRGNLPAQDESIRGLDLTCERCTFFDRLIASL